MNQKNKNILLLLFVMAVQVLIPVMALGSAPAPASWSAGTVAQGLWNSTKYVAKTVWNLDAAVKVGAAVGAVACATEAHPVVKVGAALGAAALIKVATNYRKIRSLDKKRELDHLLLGDDEEAVTKFYKWELQEWATAHDIADNWQNVLRRFSALSTSNQIRILNNNNAIIQDPTWQQIRAAITQEKKDFRTDISTLEKDHVVYFDFMSGWFDSFGVQRDYKQACAQAPVNAQGERANPNSPGSWTAEQEKSINTYMENPWEKRTWLKYSYRPLFCLVKPNYGYAAQTYWKMYKVWQRLVQLEKLLLEVETKFANVAVRSSAETVIKVITENRMK